MSKNDERSERTRTESKSARAVRVLVVDDEAFVRESLEALLTAEGFEVRTAAGVRAAQAMVQRHPFDAIVTDLRMPGEGGLALIDEARAQVPPIPILVLTGAGTVAEAVAAMKKGAFDFLQKPVDPETLALAVRRAAEHRALLSEVQSLRDAADRSQVAARIVGRSAAIAKVQALIAQVAPTDAVVLVSGEDGAGKSVVAAAVHAASTRVRGPFVRFGCPTASESTFDAEMFGVRGGGGRSGATRAGVLEKAAGGTLVLDEVGGLSAPLQAKIAEVLESASYRRAGDAEKRDLDVRVVATTSEDLAARAKNGTFRADLYYRIAQFVVGVPPLRSRKEDLAELVTHFGVSRAVGGGIGRVDAEGLEVLASYDWPGNVRELWNVLERAIIVAGSGPVSGELLRGVLEAGGWSRAHAELREFNIRLNLDAREKELVLGALERTRGRKKDASNLLGIDARNLGYYLRKHKLQAGEE
jgi:DNA-binding NtrC family response regulator